MHINTIREAAGVIVELDDIDAAINKLEGLTENVNEPNAWLVFSVRDNEAGMFGMGQVNIPVRGGDFADGRTAALAHLREKRADVVSKLEALGVSLRLQ